MIQSKRTVQFCAFGLENTETGSGTWVIKFNENHSKRPKYFLTKVITTKLNKMARNSRDICERKITSCCFRTRDANQPNQGIESRKNEPGVTWVALSCQLQQHIITRWLIVLT